MTVLFGSSRARFRRGRVEGFDALFKVRVGDDRII